MISEDQTTQINVRISSLVNTFPVFVNLSMTQPKTADYYFNSKYLGDFTEWLTVYDIKLVALDFISGRYQATVVHKTFKVPNWLFRSFTT